MALIFPSHSAVPAFSELIRGFAYQHEGAYDFSTQQSVIWTDPDADLTLVHADELGYRAIGLHGAELVMMSGMSWEEVTQAPKDSSLYFWDLPLFQDTTYVIQTVERHYAKFRVLVMLDGYFEYAYQSDGSRVLEETVPTTEATWGVIKAMYSN